MRRCIEQARKDGLLIVNDCDGSGYYQIKDLDDAERQYWQDTARAMSILERRKAFYAILKAAGRISNNKNKGGIKSDCKA